ncbi:hypothetical protein C7444_101119 [Sphaerotilus hippei]|uniref:Uncharacterized protein n=1 Tax=Sphaerotilus hippei TaxID=744406 RepID=A0A318H5T1_9BURK|nr:hypothetical protein [Sphaerotilus hippei]PXW99290.1 hypothetical protein C7444_101119 [Sphaerotilus hippei]
MSKGKNGNKEVKKPKKDPGPGKSMTPVVATPVVAAAAPVRARRK